MFNFSEKIISALTVLMFWLIQAIFEYLFFIYLIFSSREIAAWFGDKVNLNYFLSVSGILAAALAICAVWFAKKFYRKN
ncbi:MAG: hypothetical protein Q8N90_02070 [bacterium]|nr:hypothetical protein [bacterium]